MSHQLIQAVHISCANLTNKCRYELPMSPKRPLISAFHSSPGLTLLQLVIVVFFISTTATAIGLTRAETPRVLGVGYYVKLLG